MNTDTLDFNSHPIRIAQALAGTHPIASFNFKKYKYVSMGMYTYELIEEAIKLKPTDLNDGYLKWMISGLSDGYDLALQSNVELKDGTTAHIRMIDCSGPITRGGADELRDHFQRLPRIHYEPSDFKGYQSGHSAHFYGTRLVRDLHSYLSSLLLLTQDDEEQRVDIRWVGHGLFRGAMSLRWSCNQDRYTQFPTYDPRISVLTLEE